MHLNRSAPRLAVFATLTAAAITAPLAAQDVLWTRQFGTPESDYGQDVAVDSVGSTFITGLTTGSLSGPNAGGRDTYLVKYDATGALLWTRQIGTPEDDWGRSVAVDSAGNAYITGWTLGDLGGANAGDSDIFLAKFGTSSDLLWMRQLGTSSREDARSVAVDPAGNAYLTGASHGTLGGPGAGGVDYFLVKYDASGTLLWTRQAGSAESDVGLDVAVDSAGNAYVTGYTNGSVGGPFLGNFDGFLAKHDASGNLLWARQFGTSEHDASVSVAVDNAGNAYIVGETKGWWGSGMYHDAFLVKYNAEGDVLWTRRVGTLSHDYATGVAVDDAGSVYMTGTTEGSLAAPHGFKDSAFVVKFDASGDEVWIHQTGPTVSIWSRGIAVDNAGNTYISGHTYGSFGGPNAGRNDAFVIKYGCLADCDTSTGIGVIDMLDFLCFQNGFVNGETCDCDVSTGNGVCDVFDFLCFQNAFVAGCP